MKRGRRKGGSKDKVFGCDLLEHLASTNQDIPQVLRSCSEFIEVHGIVDGIYRLSGVSSNTQKLRSEFDSEGTPDLYKDLYLQDIHCVSSLCKAYFRELPNPLLTYQLYDRFAEAVAVQLENERLVKIKEVLSDLPGPHYRTLQYLMRHLVHMATHASETNMHARNLAIVWAPNLLRSKDIESSGFNGTAAFMEVRVQSIVVEFILTHVAQLFPESDSQTGLTAERRKSLPSPSALSNQDDPFFKALPFVQYPGNMSPGDGPPPMRPYHAIIDGTDKRKGSLKGRKWMSIFNLGGRLQDPRKKSKYTPKEKEKTALRPAKSMDSLSPGPYTQEDSQHSSPRNSSLVMPSGNTESGASSIGGMASGYAVTYRRTGGASVSMVSGGNGTQGTYKTLETRGASSTDKPQAALHGVPSKAERRAGMHISGPFSVTVPLHITSGLVLGVLQGGRPEEEQCSQESVEENAVMSAKQGNSAEEEEYAEREKEQTGEKTDGKEGDDTKEDSQMDDEEGPNEGEGKKAEQREERDEEEAGCKGREDEDKEDDDLSKEEESNEGQHAVDKPSEDTIEGEYMDMRRIELQDSDAVTLSQEEEYLDRDLPLDFQDTFGFLDSMDTSGPSQLNEFSVEPPGFEEDEDEENEEEEEEVDRWRHTINTHVPLPGKSHSLPYKSFNVFPPLSSSGDDSSGPDDDNDVDSDKSEYEDMFCKSLPCAQQFHGLNWTKCQPVMSSPTDTTVDFHSSNQSDLTYTIEGPEGTTNSESLTDSESLTHTDIEMTANHGMDVNVTDQCLNQVNLSQLPLETDYSSLEEKKSEDRNTNDLEVSDSEEAGCVNDPPEELQTTDTGEDTHICSHNQVEEDCKASDDEEDTYFGPDATSSLEPSNIETSSPSDHPVTEDHANSDVQQNCSEASVTSSDVTVTDEPITEPLATGSVSLATQDEDEILELSVEQNATLHSDAESRADDDEGGDGQNEGKENGEEQDGRNTISVTAKDTDNGVNAEEIECAEETNWKTSTEIQEGPEKMTVMNLKGEGEREDMLEGEKHEVGEREEDELGAEGQIISERNEDSVDEASIETGKERREGQKGNKPGTEEQETVDEIETKEGSHLEEDTGEIKDGGVAEEDIVREQSEEQDSLSEEVGQDSSGSAHPDEQQSDREQKTAQDEDKDAVPSELGSQTPLRPPRMKEREEGRDVGLGPGVGRTVLISKPHPFKVYQVKAVPVVPPKPQHCKLTAFKQQLQQRDTERQHSQTQPAEGKRQRTDRRPQVQDAVTHLQQDSEKERGVDRDREHSGAEKGDEGPGNDSASQEQGEKRDGEKQQPKDMFLDHGSGWEPGKGEQEEDRSREDRKERHLTLDGGSVRKDGLKESEREVKRASMCFDEAVARATGKRCREKESVEKEKFIDVQFERGDQKESPTPRKRGEEGKTD